MLRELEYPFDPDFVIKKRKSLKRRLLAEDTKRIHKKIAILGGSTTHDIKDILELFLLNTGIEPEFYESEYAQYFQDVMFDNKELTSFEPDLIFIHTTNKNIREYPTLRMDKSEIDELEKNVMEQFEAMWKKIEDVYHCPVIQNNFEPVSYRLMGNMEVYDIHGKLAFINRLNERFYEYARNHENFFINDINYMASDYGLQKWADPFYWHMYKYAMTLSAIPDFSYNLANIIKSIYGKNKKAFVLDLDNTLWGGVVGDDGPENIMIGQETSMGQMYSEFQTFLKEHKDLGVLLTINSKNDNENAIAGLNRPDSVLKPEDFLVIKANWENKDKNIVDIANEINIGLDSLVFVDDNPTERNIIRTSVPEVSVPEINEPEHYMQIIDRCGFFEPTAISEDDLKRNEMYRANVQRKEIQASFDNYEDYLRTLEMHAEIMPFSPIYMSRIAQLTNKSNQFNLTTLRCSQADIENIAADSGKVTLYGKLEDKFGDNGVVSVVFGHIDEKQYDVFHIDLWLMSCRVLKRDMECAMMDTLIEKLKQKNIKTLMGYYYPTVKNKMVRDFYAGFGMEKISEDENGNTVWKLNINNYENKNNVIKVN
ncbi:MAG: HAD-IIIC family phosphatase [Butyrivibrio sp.]|nr:HAD-IIIC family phosphatase [Butyrivibrio sp.]